MHKKDNISKYLITLSIKYSISHRNYKIRVGKSEYIHREILNFLRMMYYIIIIIIYFFGKSILQSIKDGNNFTTLWEVK